MRSAPAGTLGPTPIQRGYTIPGEYQQYVRAVPVTVPSGGELSQLLYYDDCVGGAPVSGVSMAIYTDAAGAPDKMLTLAGHWEGGDTHCAAAGWRVAPVRTSVSNHSGKVWLAHWYKSGVWKTINTEGTHQFFQLEGVNGLPASLAQKQWKTDAQTGVRRV